VLEYLQERSGSEFDPEAADSFVRMMRHWEPRFAELEDAREPVRPAPEPAPPATE
jgi:hypothetical protein